MDISLLSARSWRHYAINKLGVVLLLCFVLSLSTLVNSQEVKTKAVCLPAGRVQEIRLDCGETGVINILNASHGMTEGVNGDSDCHYRTSDPCALPARSMHKMLVRCLGKKACNVAVGSVKLPVCGKLSNYFQASFECIPDNTVKEGNIIDICGEAVEHQKKPEGGYIESLSYPEEYPPESTCTCNITAVSLNARIELTMIDILLQDEDGGDCKLDWLEYATPLQPWGSGVRLCNKKYGEVEYTNRRTVLLNFKSDSTGIGRGFWIRYDARENGVSVPVEMTCNIFLPSPIRQVSRCFDEENSEAYLSCRELGVIFIHSYDTWYGNMSESERDECSYKPYDSCALRTGSETGLLERCMGQTECIAPLRQMFLPNCGVNSTYFQSQYECIPDESDRGNIVDICGDALGAGRIVRWDGYLESPMYPQAYPANLDCRCTLRTQHPTATIVIQFLDLWLDTMDCSLDSLEISTPEHKLRMCDWKMSEPYKTNSTVVDVIFKTDSLGGQRGFWLKYFREVTYGGRNAPIELNCSMYGPVMWRDPKWSGGSSQVTNHPTPGNDVTSVDESPGTDQAVSSDPQGSNMGLIVALGVIGALIVLTLVVILVYVRKRSSEGGGGQLTSEQATLDQASGVKKYSTMLANANSYSTLENENRAPGGPRVAYIGGDPKRRTEAPAYTNAGFDASGIRT